LLRGSEGVGPIGSGTAWVCGWRGYRHGMELG
jgi:hypothetical protein